MFPEFDSFGKTLMLFGVVLLVIGAALHFGGKFISLGRLPGDIRIERENFSFYFPIVTSILLSVILTLVLNFFTRR
jgi:hypothetical protein